jgi:hypothetical protein
MREAYIMLFNTNNNGKSPVRKVADTPDSQRLLKSGNNGKK